MYAEYLRDHWLDVRLKLVETIDKFTDADLDLTPFDGAYSVRQLALHIAHEEMGEVQHGITRALTAWPEEFDAAMYGSLEAIRRVLAAVHERTRHLLDGLDDGGLAREVETPWGAKGTMLALLGHVIEHEVHHRAELSLILGLMGRQGLDA